MKLFAFCDFKFYNEMFTINSVITITLYYMVFWMLLLYPYVCYLYSI